jgi:type II secretory pathway component GspD/PulD (secretin)
VKGRLVRPRWCACLALAIALSTNFHPGRAFAQDAFVVQEGKPVTPEQMKAMRRGGQPAMPPGAQPSPQPGQEPKPEDKDKKKEGDDAAKKKEADATVKRPEKPPRVPDPREFKVKLDDKGRVPPFSFIGQPWPDVMQWLASLSKCTLDWQELPNDYLNLTTDRAYPLDEVQSRINRALQARGFTAIRSDDVLSIFKIDKIEPGLIRRVEEEKLYDLKPYDYVKVSFELPPTMEVDKAKDDVKQILSPAAKVFPLVTARRLLIMDTVANLRTVSELFNTERMIQDGKIVPKEFFLKYARPQQVIEILYMMVGVDPKAKPAQTDPNAQQQQMQMMQQMQQQGRGAEAAKMMQKPDAPKVYLAYNRQRNSVLVNAPPDLLKIIEQTIRCLDVPYGDAATAAEVGGTADNQRIIKRYPLQNLDPDKFVSTLEEIGGLSPYASFKVDDNNKTVFVMASEADHKKIAALLRDFDGAGRHFKVIPLRHLPADAVAATINKMMAGQNEKKEEKRRPFWYYDYDSDRNEKKKDTIQGYGCDADIENNRLKVWGTDTEFERVNELLIQLGEVPSGQHDPRVVRVIEPSDGKSTAQLLKQLQEAWSTSGGNQLIIKVPPETNAAPKAKENEEKEKPKSDVPAKPASDRSALAVPLNRVTARFVELAASGANTPTSAPVNQASKVAAPADAASSVSQPGAPAPVTITVGQDGRLTITSTDTAALDRMEQMIEQLMPPQRRFKAYQIKHIRAMDMYLDLKNYFKEDLEKDSGGMTLDWFGRPLDTSKGDKGVTGLGKRRKLMLDWDPPSNSVIVANASPSQLAEVEEMIKEFDKVPPSDSVEKRTTRPIKIRYSKPTVIAAAIKDVYRDLLSTRDKEFERNEQKDKKSSTERMTVINYGGGGSSGEEDSDRGSAVKVGFEGALSLGADDVSGVLIVSCQKAIFDDIERMVRELDDQAAPKTTVQVYQTHGVVRADALQKALEKAVGTAWLGNRPEQQPNQTGAEGEAKPGNEKGKRHESKQEGKKEN